MRSKGCLIAVGAMLAVVAVALALVGPRLVRTGRRLYGPVSHMRSVGKAFERFTRENPWRDPSPPTLTEAQLDRFLALRRELRKLDDARAGKIPAPGEKPKLEDVPELVEGVGGVVTDQLDSFMRAGMTPAEYGYIERLVYRKWLGAMREQGEAPAALERAAREIEQAAESERQPVVAARLRNVAAEVRGRKPRAPEGIPEEIHRRLLDRAGEIEGLAESSPSFPSGGAEK